MTKEGNSNVSLPFLFLQVYASKKSPCTIGTLTAQSEYLPDIISAKNASKITRAVAAF